MIDSVMAAIVILQSASTAKYIQSQLADEPCVGGLTLLVSWTRQQFYLRKRVLRSTWANRAQGFCQQRASADCMVLPARDQADSKINQYLQRLQQTAKDSAVDPHSSGKQLNCS